MRIFKLSQCPKELLKLPVTYSLTTILNHYPLPNNHAAISWNQYDSVFLSNKSYWTVSVEVRQQQLMRWYSLADAQYSYLYLCWSIVYPSLYRKCFGAFHMRCTIEIRLLSWVCPDYLRSRIVTKEERNFWAFTNLLIFFDTPTWIA